MSRDDGKRGSTRTRQLSEKVRVFDDDTRETLKRKRLDALERDNWVDDGGDDDDSYEPDEDASDEELFLGDEKKSKKKGARKGPKKKTRHGGDQFREEGQKSKSFDEIVEDEQFHKYPSWVPTYENARAKPSAYPPRKFCYLTGLPGKYRCPVTGDYLATLDAYEVHQETRLKGLI
mmetsp:Transcript_3422/g.9761  ORF Transcript_3422/g.9761 Transcript_3422/m.9761 type:complete len:176 (-) Transcript_3422:220-747(-)